MKMTVATTTDRIIEIEATLPELISLYRAATSSGRRTASDKEILGQLAAALLTDRDVAAAVRTDAS